MTLAKHATCSCGTVRVDVIGDAVSEGYCHCSSCRAFTGQPVLAYALWPRDMVTVGAGNEHLASAPRNERTTHRFCALCGGHLMIELHGGAMIDVFPMLLTGHHFQPAAHVCYGERVIDMPDGLPKFRDMPERAGGSGEMVGE